MKFVLLTFNLSY